jgi:hypothetical protein
LKRRSFVRELRPFLLKWRNPFRLIFYHNVLLQTFLSVVKRKN